MPRALRIRSASLPPTRPRFLVLTGGLQRIAAMATLHQKLLDVRLMTQPLHPDRVPPTHDYHPTSRQPSTSASYQPASTSNSAHSPHLPQISPSGPDDVDVTLPSVQSPRKRARTSRSPTPLKRKRSEQRPDDQPVPPSEQLPPSPPFSSPGRSTLGPELAAHPPARDAMAIGSLLSSGSHQQETDSDWPSRTSSEREREGYRRQAKVPTA
jgi:hypothetical protein